MGDKPKRGRGGERARLRAIRAVDLEDARPVFERIARTAQRLSNAPFAHVTLVGSEALWMAGVAETPLGPVSRAESFAAYAIESDAVLWLEDLGADRRFDHNPFVHGEPRMRFYAGAPVTLSTGDRVGAVSIVDHAPRPYDPDLAAALEDLAALVAQEWERGRAAKALAASEATARAANRVLESIVASAPVALLMVDRRMRVMQVSQKWRHDTAVHHDVAGQSIFDIFPGWRQQWGEVLGRALRGEAIRTNRSPLSLANGEQRWIRGEATPWRDRRDRIGGLLVMTHDITDMVEAMQRLERSEQTLRLALEIGELSMWELDHMDRRVNSAGPTVLVGERDRDYETMAGNIWHGVHPADRPGAIEAWRRYERDGAPFRATFRMLQRNGPHVWVQAASELVRAADGTVERTVGVIRNIDRQKRSEMALAKAKDAAEAANRAKSEFLANMSHEIRTPLNGVMGVASALSRTALDGGQREMVGLIESSAKTLESLLSDVLDLARVESGRLELAEEPFEIGRCVADVAALFQPSAESKGLALTVEPSAEVEGVFLGDAARIRQILSNLVANAVKFTHAGQVRIGASALRTPDGAEARIWVKDTGIGFDEETKARLFGRFEQADGSITRRYGGTGLGLAISRSLAERMGGSLEASGKPGEGATFTVWLPLTRAAAGLAFATHADAETPGPQDRPPLKVLLAEDHPVNRRVVQLILEAAGVDLTCVEDGALAVEAWEHGGFDLVLMDMQMPVMDGLTAIRTIREREAQGGRPRTPIQALTANALPDHVRATRDAGADGHLTKPITADALIDVIDRTARLSGAERSAEIAAAWPRP